jgi:hypothetical protein
MKKVYTLFVVMFLLGITQNSFAQPTLTLNGQTPTLDTQYDVRYYSADNFTFAAGPSGPNQVWDFSNLGLDQGWAINFSILAPEDALGHESFPDASFVWLLNEFDAYNYYQITDDGMQLIGGISGDESFINYKEVFTDPEDALRFPATYGDAYPFSSTADQELGGVAFGMVTRTGNVEFDGYGTIITPYGTFENVLRMKIVSSNSSFPFEETQFSWLMPGEFIPLAVYTTSTDVEEVETIYFAQPQSGNPTATNQIPNTDFGVRIANNIIQDQITLIGAENIAPDALWTIVGVNGTAMTCMQEGNTVDLPSLTNGWHFLRIQQKEGQQILPFLVKK